MNLRGVDHAEVYAYLRDLESGALAETVVEKAGAPYWQGTTMNGGPSYIDWNKTRRAPGQPELAQSFKGIVFSCINLNMNAVARQPLRLYLASGDSRHKPKHLKFAKLDRQREHQLRKAPWIDAVCKGADSIDEVVDHPLLKALEWCNPDFNKNELIRFSVMSLDNIGTAFWWMQPPEGRVGRFGAIDGIWPLLSYYVRPVRSNDDGGIIDYYMYGTETYKPTNLVRMRRISPIDPYGQGYSPTQAAFAYVGLSDQFVSLQENMMTQGARMSLLLSNKDPAEPVGKAEREKFIREVNYGWTRGNTGGIAFLDGAIDAKPITFPPSDLAALKITEAAMEEVARCFGIPLSLLRDSEGNRAVADAGHYQHALLAVDPLCEIIAAAFTDWMRAQSKELEKQFKARGHQVELNWDRLFWAFDSPVVSDREQQAKVFVMLQQEGDLTPNEVRSEFGYEPVPWGDEPFISTTKAQPSVAEEQRQATNARADRIADQPKPAPGDGGKPGSSGQQEGKPTSDKPTDAAKPPKKKAIRADAATDAPRGVPSTKAILRRALKRRGLTTIARLEPKQRLELLHEVRLVAREWLRAEAEQTLEDMGGEYESKGLGGKAKEVASKFFKRANKFIRNAFVAGSLAIFGPHTATRAEIDSIDRAHQVQVEFLDNFHRELLSGEQPLDGTMVSRAQMYGASVWGAANGAVHAVVKASGLMTDGKQEHRGRDEPCNGCSDRISLGWVPVDEVEPIGSQECLENCHCVIVWRDVDGKEYEAGMGPLDEFAFGTR